MFFVYLLASKPYGTLYIGSTSDLVRRVWEHKDESGSRIYRKIRRRSTWSGSSVTTTLEAAMRREKRIKSWKRAWKIELIEKDNPHWIDLYPSISSA